MLFAPRRFRLFNAELMTLTRLSVPLILAQLAQSSMGFVDTMMAGRVSPNDLAAVAIGSSIWFPVLLFLLGILSALTPMVSQAHGGGRHHEIDRLIPQGIYLGVFLGIGAALILRHIEPVLGWFQIDATLTPLVTRYLAGVSWGFPGIGICFALRYCSEGLSLTRPGMIVSFFGLGINIVADYLLVFGVLGFPALGGAGCGPATALTMWSMGLGMVFIFWRHGELRRYHVMPWKKPFQPDVQKHLLTLGLPIGSGLFIECSVFAIIAILLARFGAQSVAAHQIALNFASMLFMIPLSIATAISVRIGFTVGRQRPAHTRRAARVGIIATLCLALISATVIALFPDSCVAIYTNDGQLRDAAAALLVYAAIFQLPDATQVSCAGALRGFKDTRMPMLLQIFAYWGIALPIGSYLGLTLNWGARGFWIGLICGLSSAAVLLLWRLRVMLRRNSAIQVS
ncbi:MATE family efflux transporter [Desulfuromonas acetoxidans]|uniref:Multidrug-efflux transporter n=1 Tax=Desulfuromonas acetoxidans (strain DSM 684 / 11070) TaxID=281689 RepID=Q1JVZ1_DESA6|nr:MATE family efflux transporter [Desulfuromonas acetoxidans]EAT14414.1 MATE efflux family protein [Desulfuromonas acetoxidans DSM 684]MBF0646552.1 MATE family efflux transporter [Desulfuromonas acetoxidans]NVD25685.1 MATE family efflux transporter [Desulfuromonas acetoxidans]NVE16981.1 MATE family efflux transporter [Desulfuromonas acetoxidans]